jgi:hypothetical protein
VDAPEIGAFDFFPEPGADDPHAPRNPLDLGSLEDFYPYVEAQIHGGLDVNSIAEVIFDSTPPPQVAARLDELRIPWHLK